MGHRKLVRHRQVHVPSSWCGRRVRGDGSDAQKQAAAPSAVGEHGGTARGNSLRDAPGRLHVMPQAKAGSRRWSDPARPRAAVGLGSLDAAAEGEAGCRPPRRLCGWPRWRARRMAATDRPSAAGGRLCGLGVPRPQPPAGPAPKARPGWGVTDRPKRPRPAPGGAAHGAARPSSRPPGEHSPARPPLAAAPHAPHRTRRLLRPRNVRVRGSFRITQRHPRAPSPTDAASTGPRACAPALG